MAKRTVVVEGGGANLYETSDSGGTFYVYKSGVWDRNQIGKTRSLEDALAVIKSHSGKAIKEIY